MPEAHLTPIEVGLTAAIEAIGPGLSAYQSEPFRLELE